MALKIIDEWLKEHRITEVECIVPDMTGNARGKFIPADKFVKEDSRLPQAILVTTVTGDYTEEEEELIGPTDSDMMLVPDANTMRFVPWAEEPTAQIIHDCHFRETGELHPLATRNVLRRVLKAFEAEGWTPVVAPEVEFYLVQKNTDPDLELEAPIGRSGRREAGRQSYSIDAVNEFEDVVADMYLYCEKLGLDVDTLIHESGLAQLEVNFLHGDALELADQVFIFKRAMRETALRHGIFATFMAKPMAREPGSALHIHQSLVDGDGNNVFSREDGGEHERFRHFIGGLQKYTPAAIAFFAPSVNSYRRLTPDFAAPTNMHWGYENRTTGIRVPDSKPEARRVENRFPGADCNPYLAIAVTLACGYLGMKNRIEPSAPHEGNAYEEPLTVARSLEQALRELIRVEELAELLDPRFIRAYHAVKSHEFEAFNKVISSWEREHLLLNV